jgi:hypothetical protein
MLASPGLGASVVKNLAVFQAVERCHVTTHPKSHRDVTPKPSLARRPGHSPPSVPPNITMAMR